MQMERPKSSNLTKLKFFLCNQGTDLENKSKHCNGKEESWPCLGNSREGFSCWVSKFLESHSPAKIWICQS